MTTTAPFNPKTPGVYIQELNAFPTSVVGVPTAIPAFIGYTEYALVSGQTMLNQPVLITSMADYQQFFGGPPNPQYDINPPAAGQNPDISVVYAAATGGPAIENYVIAPTASLQPYMLYYSMLLFYANGGGTCYIVSVGNYANPVAKADLVAGLDAIGNQVGPTMLVMPDAVSLPASGTDNGINISTEFNDIMQAMIVQSYTLQDRVAILDVYGATGVTQLNMNSTLTPCIHEFKVGLEPLADNPNQLSYGMAYFPWLNTSIVSPADVDYTNFDQQAISTLDPALSPAPASQLQQILTLFNLAQNPPVAGVYSPSYDQVQKVIDALDLKETDQTVISSNTNFLMNALPQYKSLLNVVATRTNVLPPSGAMAGVFTLSDSQQGVWNAPANMALFQTLSPTVNLTNAQQGDINVPLDGEAIDVIRYFPGKGTVVWGARTLDGNSPDWRYIQVRRNTISIEQSIKQAINQYVFAPNVASTWVAVVQMISGYLQSLWSQGGLMGDKASDAFNVQCGVPTTMTGTDVLNGIMIVQVTLQMVHPAEFIQLQFTQEMQS